MPIFYKYSWFYGNSSSVYTILMNTLYLSNSTHIKTISRTIVELHFFFSSRANKLGAGSRAATKQKGLFVLGKPQKNILSGTAIKALFPTPHPSSFMSVGIFSTNYKKSPEKKCFFLS